jgi:outer membrane immunogenic protein
MKRASLTIVSALTLAAPAAQAADMALKAPPPAPVVCTWCGWYAGVNAGYTAMENNTVNSVGTPLFANPLAAPGTGIALDAAVAGVTTPISTGRAGGFIGGGQVGYNYQSGNFLAGIEADIQGLSGKRSGTTTTSVPLAAPFATISANTTLTADKSVAWLGTLRGRLGIVTTPNLLLYATGGLAYGGVKSDTTITQALVGAGAATVNTPYGSFASVSEVRAGWALGAGGEWMIGANWSAKLEYLHYDLGTVSYGSTLSNIVTPPGGGVPTGGTFYSLGAQSSVSFRGDIVRVGLNHKFGS